MEILEDLVAIGQRMPFFIETLTGPLNLIGATVLETRRRRKISSVPDVVAIYDEFKSQAVWDGNDGKKFVNLAYDDSDSEMDSSSKEWNRLVKTVMTKWQQTDKKLDEESRRKINEITNRFASTQPSEKSDNDKDNSGEKENENKKDGSGEGKEELNDDKKNGKKREKEGKIKDSGKSKKKGDAKKKDVEDVSKIRFTQDNVRLTFSKPREGETLIKLSEEIRSGKVDVNRIPKINVFTFDDEMYSLDNRRLLAARIAAYEDGTINLRVHKMRKEEVPIRQLRKLTHKKHGREIIIRNYSNTPRHCKDNWLTNTPDNTVREIKMLLLELLRLRNVTVSQNKNVDNLAD